MKLSLNMWEITVPRQRSREEGGTFNLTNLKNPIIEMHLKVQKTVITVIVEKLTSCDIFHKNNHYKIIRNPYFNLPEFI